MAVDHRLECPPVKADLFLHLKTLEHVAIAKVRVDDRRNRSSPTIGGGVDVPEREDESGQVEAVVKIRDSPSLIGWMQESFRVSLVVFLLAEIELVSQPTHTWYTSVSQRSLPSASTLRTSLVLLSVWYPCTRAAMCGRELCV